MNSVEIAGVTKTFASLKAVDGLDLVVPEGCVYGFIGPNGSGKTTTLRMIMNILLPDTGAIKVFGEERTHAHTDRIGYLPEERGLYKKMKVRQLLRFYGSLKNAQDIKVEVDRWLEKFDLGDWADKKVETLSKGMSQKVQFIAAVVSRPEMIILDEPFSGLDPVNMDLIRESVLELQENGTTVIFSTHDMGTAETMCDYIFMIHKGRKVLDGTLADIQDQYGSDTIRIRLEGDSSFLKSMNGVQFARDLGHLQELRMADGVDPQRILSKALERAKVQHFEVAKPSLHDIFVRIAKPAQEEDADE